MNGVHLATRGRKNRGHPWCGVKRRKYKEPKNGNNQDGVKAQPLFGVIELALLFDRNAAKDIRESSSMDLQTYAAVLINAVNVIYTSLSGPQLRVIVVSARALVSVTN